MGVRTMQGGCRGTTMVRGARAGRGTGREARKRGSWNNAVEGTSQPGAGSPAWVYAGLGIRFANNDINSAGRATASG